MFILCVHKLNMPICRRKLVATLVNTFSFDQNHSTPGIFARLERIIIYSSKRDDLFAH